MRHVAATGQFDAELTDRELFAVVGRVARAARPDNPESLSQSQFDRYVADHRREFPGVPTARAIYMRLNPPGGDRITWRSIVRAACGSDASIPSDPGGGVTGPEARACDGQARVLRIERGG